MTERCVKVMMEWCVRMMVCEAEGGEGEGV